MYPAPSIIVFTVLSGMGFGLMAWLGSSAQDGGGCILPALALALAGSGLLASLFHLGQPRRFLKAFSQWRSSWLSREALLAVATMIGFLIYAGLWCFLDLRARWLGALVAACALATVFATAMIYAQMRSVPRWQSPFTPAIFLVAALAGGALLAGAVQAARPLLAALAALQIADWLRGDRRFNAAGSTLATATGLGSLGQLRLLEPPHTGPNYLMREMVYVVARTHAGRLRLIGLALATMLPLTLSLTLTVGPVVGTAMLLSHAVGVIVLRWLFFAQAEHVVGLYYGRR